MKMKTNVLKTGCSRIFLFVMVIALCVVPSVQADVIVYADQELDINYDVGGFLKVYGIANLDTGAYAAFGIKAYPGSTVNINGGTIGIGSAITVFAGPPAATVTVFGTNFAVDGVSLDPSATEFTTDPITGSSVLTVTYTDGNGNPNGDPVNLLFISDIPINLVNTAVSDPATLIEELIATVSNMNLQQGIDNSLDAKLDAALGALDDVNQNNDAAAINTLQAFINVVEAQRDNKITSDQADILIADAQAIIDLLST